MRSEKIESYTVRYELLQVKEVIDSKKLLSRCTLDPNSLNNLREILQKFQDDQTEFTKLLKRCNKDPELYKRKAQIIQHFEDRAKDSYQHAYDVMMEARDNFCANIVNALDFIKKNPELIEQLTQIGFDSNEAQIVRELLPYLGKPGRDQKILERTLNLSKHPLPGLKPTLMTATNLGKGLEHLFSAMQILEKIENKLDAYLDKLNRSIYQLDLDHKQAIEGANDIKKYEKECHAFLDSREFQEFQEHYPERAKEIEKELIEKIHEAFEAIYQKNSINNSEGTEYSSWSTSPADIPPQRNNPSGIDRIRDRVHSDSFYDPFNKKTAGETPPPQWTNKSTIGAINAEFDKISELIEKLGSTKLKAWAEKQLAALEDKHPTSLDSSASLPKLKKLLDEYSDLRKEISKTATAENTFRPSSNK